MSTARAALEQYLSRYGTQLGEDAVTRLVAYAELISRWNRLTSLVQAKSTVELVEAHIIDCLTIGPLVCGPNLVDVGSGAGLPGIVIAIANPEIRVTLVEANQRRARFLEQAKIELNLDNVTLANVRIEAWQPKIIINCVTARAFSSVDKLYQQCAHIVTAQTRIVAMKGRLERGELRDLATKLEIPSSALTSHRLKVPGRDHRHAVVIDWALVSKI